eukprot:9212568-Karenia_brevis.AAC.1
MSSESAYAYLPAGSMPPIHEASSVSRARPTSHVSSALETIDVPSRSNSPPERMPAMSARAA